MQHALNGGEALGQLVGRVGLGNAGNLLELLIGLLHFGVVFQGDHIAVAQVGGLHAVESAVAVVVLDEVLQGFLPGDEGGLQDIVHQVDLCTDAFRLGIGQAAVDVYQDLTGLIQLLHHDVQVVGQGGEAAHDDQAGHRHTHGGKGHKPMEEDPAEAFL